MHVLVTRPQESAHNLITRLQELGHQVIVDPLIHITPINPEDILKVFPVSFEAIITTSQQAIRCLANLTSHRDFSLWCVGGESAKIARELGFQNIHTGQGSSEDLLDKLLATLKPSLDKPLVHVSGDVIRVDMAKALHDKGYPAQNIIVYQTQEATALSAETQNAIKSGNLDAALFYSPRTGLIFQNLCKAAHLKSYCGSMSAICLSDSIKTSITQLPWKNIRIAKKTTTDDLLIALMMAD
jgi:uroporphyrinogen-III synthase